MTHQSTNVTAHPVLEYPFGDRWSPEPGEPFELADGVFWLRMPLPIDLDHINLWLLRDGDGWTIVDTGYDSPLCEQVWEQVFDEFLDPSDVTRVIVTHLHPDHMGLAAWLAYRCDCPIWISRGEFEQYRDIVARDPVAFESTLNDYMRHVDFDDTVKQGLMSFFSLDRNPTKRRVEESMCRFISDTEPLKIDNRVWRVVTGNGHSPEHACLFCPELSLFISGDQSLPRISSNVSVFPDQLNSNPLGDWLRSCQKLCDEVPSDVLVLPSHQEPFKGLVPRMQRMIADHHAELEKLRNVLVNPCSVADVRQLMFPRELKSVHLLLATGETLAHLSYLRAHGGVSLSFDQSGVAIYQIN